MPPQQLSKIDGMGLCFSEPFFHEFALCVARPVAEVNAHLLEHGILGGYDLGQDYPALKDHMLVAVTEMNSQGRDRHARGSSFGGEP